MSKMEKGNVRMEYIFRAFVNKVDANHMTDVMP
jgi:hypothetical protein